MGDKSNISWTDATWNPTTGCSHVSPGCENCYAEALSLRRGWSSKPWTKPNARENVILHPDRLDLPLKWKKPRRVFVDSMSDLFHEEIPDDFIAQVFGVMAGAPRHIFQVLTKRPERMAAYLADPQTKFRIWHAGRPIVERVSGREMYDVVPVARPGHGADWCYPATWPLPNVWLGVSVEDQRRADERIPLLLQTPAAVRFLSVEPLLGPVCLDQWLEVQMQTWRGPGEDSVDGWRVVTNPLTGLKDWRPGVDWVIVGGESGPGYRPMDLDWARSLRDQCQAAGVALWFKQTGGPRPGTGEELDGHVWHEFPKAVPS